MQLRLGAAQDIERYPLSTENAATQRPRPGLGLPLSGRQRNTFTRRRACLHRRIDKGPRWWNVVPDADWNAPMWGRLRTRVRARVYQYTHRFT